MALHINLLHEREAQRTQRERDPLKLGFLGVLAVAGVLAVLHLTASQQVAGLQGELGSLRAEQARLKPEAETAARREKELSQVLRSSEALARRAERRMLWGPVLAAVASVVPREVQLDAWNGGVGVSGETVEIALDGRAAGSEPRKVAEDFRLAVKARLATVHPKVDVKFRTLEDENATVTLDGQQWPTAHFALRVSLPHPRKETSP